MRHSTVSLAILVSAAVAACSQPAPQNGVEEPPAETPAASEDMSAPAEETSATGAEPDAAAANDAPPQMATVDIEEWNVPWEGRPRDPYTLDGETVWFVGQVNSYIARLDVATGQMERIDLREGAGPHNLIVDPTGDVWYAGNRDAHIGRYDVDSGEFEIIDTPRDTARDPHTQIWNADGDIWFTSQGANSVGFLDVSERSVEIIAVPTPGARPYGIKLAPDGTIWVALFGTHKLASIDPETMELTEHDLPREEIRPRRIGITSDGRVWYGDYNGGYLGVFDPASGEVTEWAMPSGENARPYALAVDGQDRIWFVETGVDPNYFVGFDPESESFFSITAIPSGGGVVRHMQYLPQNGEIWFGSDMGTIGRARVE
ncbi:lyase [Maricaulis sp.]|uniref:Vgb family protein n=1 Tax=Maricaulis sp. TaxID=1486257 RepID=UPI00260684FF|nr:lyase [Maricaulis sp.]